MKKHILVVILLSIMALVGYGYSASTLVTDCDLGITLLNQDPYPAVPSSYVNVVFQVSGLDNTKCKGAVFEIIPSYPFSLDDNSYKRELNESAWMESSKKDWLIPYKIRVSDDAIDGETGLEVHYSSGTSGTAYFVKIINLTVEDVRSNFDALIQDVSGSDVSIAIANVGKNTANSVIIKIPEQEGYRTSGSNAQIIGNLAASDYTIVTFSLSSAMSTFNRTSFQKGTDSTPQMPESIGEQNLTVEIDYTDSIGERRIVEKQIPFNMREFASATVAGVDSTALPGASRFASRGGTNIFELALYAAIIIIIAIAIIFRKKIIKIIKKDSKKISSEMPDWIKKEKSKGA